MKLMDLRSALRKLKGNPTIVVELTPGVPIKVIAQKTALLEELGRAFEGERTADTGLTFDEDTGIMSGPLSATIIAPGNSASIGIEPMLPFDDDEDDEDDELL